MKKTLLLLASAAMLIVGCAKEKLGPDAGTGEMVTANFTAQMQGMPQTKSVTDGEGSYANRCVMEIYYKGVLYTRDVKPIEGMKATFAPQLVSNRTYDVLFWADCGEDLADKYYTTDAEGLGLQAVEMKATAYAANDDARDAFYTTESVPVGQQVSSETFTLTRPFAQVNIITTDAAIIKNANLYPDGVKMVYKAPTKFNLLTETLSEEKKLTVTGIPYEALDTTSVALTLEMDYLFTGEDKSALDIAFEASKTGESTVTSHSFTNIPVQRNYRTNIKGALLTTTGNWTATIVPTWATTVYDMSYYEAPSIQDAREYINNEDGQKSKEVNLDNVEIKQDDVESDGTIHFTLTENSPEDLVNFSLPEIPEGIDCNGWTIDYDGNYPTKNVNVNAPAGTSVKVNAPNSHVTVNGTNYDQIIASTSENSLIIPQGVSVQTLIVNKGGVEIHGTVGTLQVVPEVGAKVFFRACENLSSDVYSVAKDYIKIGYKGEKNQDGSWNIVVDPTVYVVEEMTETMVIPEGITHLVASDELAAARLAAEPWMSEDDARDPFFMDNTVTKVSLPASMTPVSGLFNNTRALKEVEFDGSGNLVFENVPIVNSYYVEKITIKNLPETCQFYGVNDNSKPNQYLINLDTPKSDGPKKIEIFLPAGWIEKGYQYKFNSCCATPFYTYVDGKLIGYCKNAKWYTVTEVNENGVQSIIASEDGNDQTAVIYAAENTVIPSGVTELVASEEMQNDPARTADPEWPFDQNQALKSVWFPTTLLVNNEGKQEFNGTFCRCKNLESITLEGGNDMLITFPMVAWCTGFKSLKIEKLPTTFAFNNGCNDNTSVNPYWLYTDGGGMPGVTVKVYLPNGWKAAGYQYKLSSQIDSGIPTIEVYEADAEGNYQLLGKSVNNVWQDPE